MMMRFSFLFRVVVLVACVAVITQAQGTAAGDELVRGQADIVAGDIAANAAIPASKLDGATVRDRKGSFNLPDPVSGDDGVYQIEFPAACTLQEVACNCKGGTSVVISLYERARATPETGTTNMMTSTLTCDNDGAVTTSFSDAALAADVPLALGIGTVTGSPTMLRVYVKCRTN